MKLIAGLGNPGPRYERTRHNLGFMVVDLLAQRWGVSDGRYEKRFEAIAGTARHADQDLLLLKPQTFMNLSGRSVRAAAGFYKIAPQDVLIICDDLDLELGRLRIRARGSGGGHKGLTDVLRHLGTDEVARLRIGIGKVHPTATTEFVLSRFWPEQRERVERLVQAAADAAACWNSEGVDEAMNRYNAWRDEG